MFRIRNFLLLVALLAGAAILAAPTQAKATYEVILTSGTHTLTITDNEVAPVLDTNPATNGIGFSDLSFAGYTIDFSGSTNTPAAGGLALQTQNTLTVTADTTAVSPLLIDVFANGYTLGLSPGMYALAVNNGISSTLLQGTASASALTEVNGGGAGLTTASASISGPILPPTTDSAGSPTLGTPLTANPFSLDSVLTINNLALGGSADITWTSTANVVPAPGALVLLASGIPVLAGAWLKRRKKAVPA